MDSESLAQVRHIVTEVTQGVREELQGALARSTTSLQESIAEVRRGAGVLTEDLHHKLDLVIEGQQFLREQVADAREEGKCEAQETRGLLQLSYQQLHQRVENLERRVSSIEQSLGRSS